MSSNFPKINLFKMIRKSRLLFIVIVLFNALNYAAAQTVTTYLDSVISSKDSVLNTPKSIDSVRLDTIETPKFYFGIASFYSSSLEGSETSTQEKFRHNKMTAASNRFKLNTWLRVTNLSNDKTIIVRVNDRMHPRMDAKGRIVDLSYAGAKQLGFISRGITKVKVQVVPKGTKM